MNNDNDSNADLDLNLDDEFDLENSDSNLSLDDNLDPTADAIASDDSVELDDLFGDSDDEFDFSKKEEISLDFSATDAMDQAGDDASESLNFPSAVEASQDTLETNVGSDDRGETIENADSAYDKNAPDTFDAAVDSGNVPVASTTEASGGILSKIFGIFSRKKQADNYGEEYSEYDDDDLQEETESVSQAPITSADSNASDAEFLDHEEVPGEFVATVEIEDGLEADSEPIDLGLHNEDALTIDIHQQIDDEQEFDFDDEDEINQSTSVTPSKEEAISAQPDESFGAEEPDAIEIAVDSATPSTAENDAVEENDEPVTAAAEFGASSSDHTDNPSELAGDVSQQPADDFAADSIDNFQNAATDDLQDTTTVIDAPELVDASNDSSDGAAEVVAAGGAAATRGILSRFLDMFRRKPDSTPPGEATQSVGDFADQVTVEMSEELKLTDAVNPQNVEESLETQTEHSSEQHSDSDEFNFDGDQDQQSSAQEPESSSTELLDEMPTPVDSNELPSGDDLDLSDEFDLDDADLNAVAVEPESVEEENARDEFSEDTLVKPEVANLFDDPLTEKSIEHGSPEIDDSDPALVEKVVESADEQPTTNDSQELEHLLSENEKLKSELVTAESRLQQNQDAFDANRRELAELTTLHASLQSELQDLKAQHQTLEAELQEAKQSQETAAVETAALAAASAAGGLAAGATATSGEDIDNLKQQLEKETGLRKDAEQFLEEAEVQRNEVARLLRQARTELKQATEAKLEGSVPEEINQQLDDFAKQVDSLTDERDQIRSELAQHLNNTNEVQSKFEALEKQNFDLEKRLADSEAKASSLDAERLTLISQSESTDSEMTRIKSELEAAKVSASEFDAEFAQAESKIAELEETRSGLETKLNESDAELKSKTSSLESLKSELQAATEKAENSNDSTASTAELENARRRLTDLESQLQAKSSRLEQTESELESLRSEIESAESAMTKSDSKLQEVSRLKSDLESFSSEKSRLEENMSKLQVELAETKAAQQVVNDQTAELKVKLSSSEARNEHLAKSLEEKTATENALTTIRSQLDEAKLETMKARQQLEVETTGFQSRLAAEQQLVSSRGEETTRMTAEIDQLKIQLSDSQKRLESEQSMKAELSQELERQRGSIEALKAKLESADAISAVNQQLQDALNRQERRLNELENSQLGSLGRIESLIASHPKPSTAKSGQSAKTKKAKNSGKSNTKAGDKLTKINGIGPVLEKRLNKLGINSLRQIAKWTKADVQKWESKLDWTSIARDGWVEQAKQLSR